MAKRIPALPPATEAVALNDLVPFVDVSDTPDGVTKYTTVSVLLAGATSSAPIDATYLTLSANTSLTNERVLLEGTNITFDTSTPGQLTINGASGFTAGGDLTGNSSSQTVAKVNGTAVAAGTRTTGQPLRATGANAADFGALDLANASAITGSLPAANQAAQTMGGDSSGTTAACVNGKVNGVTYPAGGSLTTGQIPRVTAGSTVAYGALDLTNTNAVSGRLPVANQAPPGTSGQVPYNNGTQLAASGLTSDGTNVTCGGTSTATAVLVGGGTPATTGCVRAPLSSICVATRDLSGTTDLYAICVDGSNSLYIGQAAGAATNQYGVTVIGASSQVQARVGNALQFSVNGTSFNNAMPRIGASTAFASEATGTQAMANADQTLPAAVYQCADIATTGAITADRNATLPSATNATAYGKWIDNQCTGSFNVIFKCASGTTVSVPSGKKCFIWVNAAGVSQRTAFFP